MKNEINVRDAVTKAVATTFGNIQVDGDTDFFSVGISSLSVVNFQMVLEDILGCSVETPELMLNSTLNGWINQYELAHKLLLNEA